MPNLLRRQMHLETPTHPQQLRHPQPRVSRLEHLPGQKPSHQQRQLLLLQPRRFRLDPQLLLRQRRLQHHLPQQDFHLGPIPDHLLLRARARALATTQLLGPLLPLLLLRRLRSRSEPTRQRTRHQQRRDLPLEATPVLCPLRLRRTRLPVLCLAMRHPQQLSLAVLPPGPPPHSALAPESRPRFPISAFPREEESPLAREVQVPGAVRKRPVAVANRVWS
mmetsp:Transcript_13772/g.29078  ORF Transcript_13772/g.29078 Transcript_13772/m.29078 type:complete len:221 (+) Transcript_13772:1757-2419(+)